jgi:hypothetical protein
VAGVDVNQGANDRIQYTEEDGGKHTRLPVVLGHLAIGQRKCLFQVMAAMDEGVIRAICFGS